MKRQRKPNRRLGRCSVGLVALLVALLAMGSLALGESWPRCISGCTANDVEFMGVTAEVAGSCTPGGSVDVQLFVSLHFNRKKSYCVRFVADAYIDGELAEADLVSEPINVFSKGDYPDIYFASLSLPCGSTLTLENVQIFWSVDKSFKEVSSCADGSCKPYGPRSKCTGDQLGTIVVPLQLDALDDAAETDEETPVTIDLLGNDFLGSPPTVISNLEDGDHGQTEDNGDGTIVYTPDLDFSGVDSFAYSIQDAQGNFDIALVTVTVYPVNDSPYAEDDQASADENEPVQIAILNNDTDTDGNLDPSSVQIVTPPALGEIDLDTGSGDVAYVSYGGACGEDTFTYTVDDNEGATSNEATVRVSIACNEPPLAGDDSATTDENTSIEIDLVANDTDSDGTLDIASLAITQPPSLGTLSVHPSSGLVTYLPDPSSCGEDSFRYTIADNDRAVSNEAQVLVAVLCDDPPLAIDDLYQVSEAGSISIDPLGVLANDITTPDDPLHAALVSGVAHGTLVLREDGGFEYTHDGSETTSDSFTYYASDDSEESNLATVSLIILPTNDSPLAQDDEATTDEDTPIVLSVLDNDSDPDGDALSVDWVSQPSHGTVNNLGDGIRYTPDPNYHGTDTFVYRNTDGNGGQAEASVVVEVLPVNDPPQANDDSASTDEDVSVEISVLDNDGDPDGDSLLLQTVGQPDHGTATIAGTQVTYTPDPDYHGSDALTYTISDGNGGSSSATVQIAVSGVNDPPMAWNDGESTTEDEAVTIDVLANDSDPDGDALTVQSVGNPEHGSAINNGTDVVYIPNANFYGEDEFTYVVSDGNGGTAQASVFVTIDPVNDAPVAQDDLASTQEDSPVLIEVLENDSDPDGDALTILSVGAPGQGSAAIDGDSILYTPDPDAAGADTLTYTVTDASGATATASVHVTVLPINDPPEAVDDAATTDEEQPVVIDVLANDSDPEGDTLTITSVAQPQHGTVENLGTSVRYLPDPDYDRSDTFTYTVSDGNGGTATATVAIEVSPINDPPEAQDDSASTAEDTLVSIPVLDNDSDPDGDFLVVEFATSPANGSVLNGETSITYIPDPGFNGIDSFSYTIIDNNGGTAVASVTVAVAAVNDPPVAVDDSASTDEETAISILVLDNDSDPDGDAIRIQSVTQPEDGKVVRTETDVTYTPDPGYSGIDSFSYTITDGNGGVATATVTVAVLAVNDPPVAQDDSAATDEDIAVIIDVLANDSDPDGDVLTISSTGTPEFGTVTIDGGQLTYVPTQAFSGIDRFDYTIVDAGGETASATVTVAVAAVNEPPIARADEANTAEGSSVTISVLGNDTDPDNDVLAIQSVTQPQHGVVSINGLEIVYTPDPLYNGSDSFSYTVFDGNGGTSTTNVELTVSPVNDAPIAQDDSASTSEEVPVSIDVLSNDFDPDADVLEIQSATQPQHGDAVVDGSQLIYTPDVDFTGTDPFEYTVNDGQGASDVATVTVTVVAVNDPPVAQDDSATAGEDIVLTIPVLENDSDPEGDPIRIESLTQPSHGSVETSGSSVIYTPNRDYSGDDSFSYTIVDGQGGKDSATVSILVLPLNDPPIAQDDSQRTQEDQSVSIAVLANDSDPDGDALVISSIEQPSGGHVTNLANQLLYEPKPGFNGTDSFVYTISDGKGGASTARVSVLVESLNNAPIAQNDSAATQEDKLVSIDVLANDSDADGDFLMIESFTDPQNGTVLNARTELSYIPNPGFQGVDSFTYVISDGNGGTDRATVTISVAEVNDPPFAQDDSAVADEGTSVSVAPLLNDSDPNGDPLTIESVGAPENGTVEIIGDELVYTPEAGFDGVDTFLYSITDSRGLTDTATVFIAVAPVNDAPVAQDDNTTTFEDNEIVVPVLSNDSDPDGDRIQILSIAQPGHGTAIVRGTDISYIPDEGFSGTDEFEYTISDEAGQTSTATVIVGITPAIAGAGGAEGDTEACSGGVIISEVAWAGTSADSRDEWIELRNLGTSEIDLQGWTLRWRSTHPETPDDQIWKVVELSGVLSAAPVSACDAASAESGAEIRIEKLPGDAIAWTVTASPDPDNRGLFTLERRSEETIRDRSANQLYDTGSLLSMELSDRGEVLMLQNPAGEVVDTANASNLGKIGWVAGSAENYASMERIDPLGPDTAENWQTNMGLVISGHDAANRPLRATPGLLNSPDRETLVQGFAIEASVIRRGENVQVGFALTRQDRRTTGWPWISVLRPGFAAGAGGGSAPAQYSFSGQYEGNDRYVLDVGTSRLTPGSYVFWFIHGIGEAVYVPLVISP